MLGSTNSTCEKVQGQCPCKVRIRNAPPGECIDTLASGAPLVTVICSGPLRCKASALVRYVSGMHPWGMYTVSIDLCAFNAMGRQIPNGIQYKPLQVPFRTAYESIVNVIHKM